MKNESSSHFSAFELPNSTNNAVTFFKKYLQ